MGKQSAGLLLYRRRGNSLEVLLVHPGGPFWANRDLGAWSVPKGEYGADEPPLEAARREFREELGTEPTLAAEGEYIALDAVQQRGGKVVRAWAHEGDLDPAQVRSNRFTLEWPPRSGRRQEFPEIDRAEWFPVEEARRRILPGQLPLLEQLSEQLGG